MRLGDTGLDDVLNEVQYLADRDGRWHARLVRRVVIAAYRGLKVIALLALYYPWRDEQSYSSAGYEPLNVVPEWRQR